MKLIISTICVSGLLLAASPLSADETHSTEPKAASSTEKKTTRKKRQLMCKECGKPEKNCECKGEGHRQSGEEEHKH